MQYNDKNPSPCKDVLWFDVERGCNTTPVPAWETSDLLWFDVERGCNTTLKKDVAQTGSCGLM